MIEFSLVVEKDTDVYLEMWIRGTWTGVVCSPTLTCGTYRI